MVVFCQWSHFHPLKKNKTHNACRLTDVAGNTHGLNCFLQGQATYCSTAQNKET